MSPPAPADDLVMDDRVEPAVTPLSRWQLTGTDNRLVIAGIVTYVWLRIGFILSTGAFETPDTQSYRSGQATRPPGSAALLSVLGNTPYIVVSAAISTMGFVALAWALWDTSRRAPSYAMVAAVFVVSMLPTVTVYEHWLVPDSLLVGLTLMALALAFRGVDARWYPWVLGAICVLITTTKEVGFVLVVLVALVWIIRGSWRAAAAVVLTCLVLCVVVVLPASNRQGRVLWFEPKETQLTMERFRLVIAGLMWPDLSPQLDEVSRRSGECGMTMDQLVAETFLLTDAVVSFKNCPDLWEVVDDVSQVDVLEAHARNPVHVRASIERGFAPDMYAMAVWGGYPIDQRLVMTADRLLAAAVALLPFVVLAIAIGLRKGRRLALVGTLGSMMAFMSALLDPSSQDRHTIVFRLAAFGIGLMALNVATNSSRTEDVERAESGRLLDDAMLVH